MSVTYGQNDNYTDIYDGKMANCCENVRGNKKLKKSETKTKQKAKAKQKNKQTKQTKTKTNKKREERGGGL